MIVVSITGGLGNQMFQYAFGKAVAERLNVPLMLDISFYNSFKNLSLEQPRNFNLDIFNISSKELSKEKLDEFVCSGNELFKKGLFRIRRLLTSKTIFKEKKPLCFDPNVFNIKDNTYLTGYWQTEKYFIGIRDLLINEFTLKSISPEAQILEKQVNSDNSVSLHIRRGDYTQTNNRNFHGLLSPDYYVKAIELVKNQLSDPVFYIFSDDPEWVLSKFNMIDNYQLVSGKGPLRPAEEMFLMSKCKHNIIANSSFSWWGAWLNTNPSKIVIAPKSWIVNTPVDAAILPQQWRDI